MAVIKIKASVEKKDERAKNVRELIEIMKHVYSYEKLLISFRDKFQDWTDKANKEWRSCYTEKSDVLQNPKFVQVLSTAIISLCLLESLRCGLNENTNIYFTLGVVYYLLLVVVDAASIACITYLCSPSRFLCHIYEYFENVLAMSRFISHRVSYVQQKMNLNMRLRKRLQLDLNIFENKSENKNSYSLLSLFSIYGIFIAFLISISFSYFQYEPRDNLTYATFYSVALIVFSKMFSVLKFLRIIVNRRQHTQELTVGFISWFGNKFELRRVLQESRLNSKILSVFSPRSSDTILLDPYLIFLIFAVTCEEIFHSNLDDRDLEKAVLVLLYGQFSILKEGPQVNELIEITASCGNNFDVIKVDDENSPKTNKWIKHSFSKDMRGNIATGSAGLHGNETFRSKSRIPKMSIPVQSKCKTKSGKKIARKLLAGDENEDLVTESDFNPCNKEENANSVLDGTSVTPRVGSPKTVTEITVQPPLCDENVADQKELSTERIAGLVIHSDPRCKEGNAEADLSEMSQNTETVSTLTTSPAIDPSSNCLNVDGGSDFTSYSDLEIKKGKEFNVDDGCIEYGTSFCDGKENISTENSDLKSCECKEYVTDSTTGTQSRVSGILDNTSRDTIYYDSNVASQNDSSNSLDPSVNKMGDFKLLETGTEKNEIHSPTNPYLTRQESHTDICPPNESEESEESLRLIQNILLNLQSRLMSNSNCGAQCELSTSVDFISGYEQGLFDEFITALSDPNYPEAALMLSNLINSKNVDNELSEAFANINIQSDDIPDSASKNKVSPPNPNEKFEINNSKEIFQIGGSSGEPKNDILNLYEALVASSPKTEDQPELKSRDIEQNKHQNSSDQNAPNQDLEYFNDNSYQIQQKGISPTAKLERDRVIVENEKLLETILGKNEESYEHLPQKEPVANNTRDDLKTDETCVGSFVKSEVDEPKGCLPKVGENFTMLTEDSPIRNGSEPERSAEDLSINHEGVQDAKSEIYESLIRGFIATSISNETDKSESNSNFHAVNTDSKAEISGQELAKAKATHIESSQSTTSKISEQKPSEDVTTASVNNTLINTFCAENSSPTKPRRKIKAVRRVQKAGNKRQGRSKNEEFVPVSLIPDLSAPENLVETIANAKYGSVDHKLEANIIKASNLTTESSTLNVSDQTMSTSATSANFLHKNEETIGDLRPEEISTSQVENESKKEIAHERVTLGGMPSKSNGNVESIAIAVQTANVNEISDTTSGLNGSEHYKSPEDMSAVNILKGNESGVSISPVRYLVAQNEGTSDSKLLVNDSSTIMESKQINGNLISASGKFTEMSSAPVLNKTQKDKSKENIFIERAIENYGKEESNQNIEDKGETKNNSCDLNNSEQIGFSKDISTVKDVNAYFDETSDSFDVNAETYMSLSERKILVADTSNINELDDISSFAATSHSSKEVLQNTMCEQVPVGKFYLDGSSENSSFSIKNYNHLKTKGQVKVPHTEDSVAINVEVRKQNESSLKCREMKNRNTEITKKKNRRFLCLQKYRGISIEEETGTEKCEIQEYERSESYVGGYDELSIAQETSCVKILEQKNDHSENTRKLSSNEFSNTTVFKDGNETSSVKYQSVESWIRSLPSDLAKSSTVSERPPTGSSEAENAPFHKSTSASDTSTSKSREASSESSVSGSVVKKEPSIETYSGEVGGEDENFDSECQQKETLSEGGKEGIRWMSNLGFNNSEESCKEFNQATNVRSTTNQCCNIDRVSVPLKYHLKCNNLDVSIVDLHSHLTLRFVKEGEQESAPIPKNRKLVEIPSRSGSSEGMHLPTDISSLHSGHFSPTHPFDIPVINNIGNNVQMSVEHLEGLVRNVDASTVSKNVSPYNTFDRPTECQRDTEAEPPVVSAVHGGQSCPHPTTENNEMSKPAGGDDSGICPSEDKQSHVNVPSASNNKNFEIIPDERNIPLDLGSKSRKEPNDFIFESDLMTINYGAPSKYDSISISFRRQPGESKLTFKSQENKLYLKTCDYKHHI